MPKLTSGPFQCAVPCPLCKAPSPHVLLLEDVQATEYNLVECSRCGLRFFDPGPSQEAVRQFIAQHGVAEAETCRDFGVLERHDGDKSPTDQKRYLQLFARLRLEKCQALLEMNIPTPRVYEIGCGTGWFLKACLEAGADVRSGGCDANETAVQIACSSGDASGICWGFFHDVAPPAKPYDIIIMNDVLEHTLTPFDDLKKAWRISSPGAMLYVKTFIDDLDPDHMMMRPPEHVIHFTRKSLRECIERAGWTVTLWNEAPEWAQVAIYARKV